MIIVLDAGHGGKDPGAVGANGLKEKDVVLKLVKKTKSILEAKYEKVEVLLTRSTDVFLELSDRSIKSNQFEADVFISFHNNSHSPSAHGFESFIYNGKVSNHTVTLQNLLHEENMKVCKKYGVSDRSKKRANHSVTRETHASACLLEFLFISNVAENKLLQNESVLDEFAEATAKAIARFGSLKAKTSTPKQNETKPTANMQKIYRVYIADVQIGAYSSAGNILKVVEEALKDGKPSIRIEQK